MIKNKYPQAEYSQTYYEKHPWMSSRRNLRNRDLIKISNEELEQLWIRDCAYKMQSATLSRKDYSLPYTVDNCYYQEFSEFIKSRGKTRLNQETLIRRLWLKYQLQARRRHLKFELSLEYFQSLIFGVCHYCGQVPQNKFKSRSKHYREFDFYYNGIDRVNNYGGYTIKNTVTCCKQCNTAKGKLSKKYFLEWINQVIKNLGLDKH